MCLLNILGAFFAVFMQLCLFEEVFCVCPSRYDIPDFCQCTTIMLCEITSCGVFTNQDFYTSSLKISGRLCERDRNLLPHFYGAIILETEPCMDLPRCRSMKK